MCNAAAMMGVQFATSMVGGAFKAQGYRDQARVQREQANREDQAGAYNAARYRDQADRRIAQMENDYLSAGLALEGSPAAVIEDAATEAALDEEAIKYGATLRSQSLRQGAQTSDQNAGRAVFGGFLSGLSGVANEFTSQRRFDANRTFLTNPYMLQA